MGQPADGGCFAAAQTAQESAAALARSMSSSPLHLPRLRPHSLLPASLPPLPLPSRPVMQVVCKPGSIKPHRKFKGEIYALSKEEGGRHTPFFSNYKPQFFFRTADITGGPLCGAVLLACAVHGRRPCLCGQKVGGRRLWNGHGAGCAGMVAIMPATILLLC